MFYCEDCRKERDWPESFVTSRGRCEMCEKSAVCYDWPSSALREHERRQDAAAALTGSHATGGDDERGS